ncbi:ABC transporter permease [Nocardioides insulae]|uniref:ABC transporter permease n=1 Tax=Nocardioides insulae TaxID=394734 RepID=UPI00040262DC|nr:ABC transporter permease [Nocardioides insulae]
MTATRDTPDLLTAPPRTPTFWGTVRLVAQRELRTRVRSKAFLIMTGLLLAGAVAVTVLPNVIGGSDPDTVAVVGEPPLDLSTLVDAEGTPYVEVEESGLSQAEAEQLLRDGDVDAVLLFEGGQVTVEGLREAPERAVQAFSSTPQVELIDDSGPDPATMYFVSIAFGLAFFMGAMTFGNQIAASVVEEKQTRIVEVLLSAVSARALLTGKVLGNTLLAVGQIALIALAAGVGLAVTGKNIGVGELGPSIVWFVVFFLVGFTMISSLFAASASLISRSEDIGAATTPVTTLIMIPYLLSFVASSNETLLHVLAWLPISSPISMPTLVYSGDALWWEPIGALLLLVLTTVAVIAVGERVYRNSLLRTGRRVRLKDALRSR